MSATIALTSENDQQAKCSAKASDETHGYESHAGTFLGLRCCARRQRAA